MKRASRASTRMETPISGVLHWPEPGQSKAPLDMRAHLQEVFTYTSCRCARNILAQKSSFFQVRKIAPPGVLFNEATNYILVDQMEHFFWRKYP